MLLGRLVQLGWGVHRCVEWLHSCLTLFKCLEVTLIRLLVGGLFDRWLVGRLDAVDGWSFVLLDRRFHGGDGGW